MIYLLDTNILIYLIKKKPPQVADRIDALPAADQLAMSFVTWAELLQGAAGSTKRVVLEQQLERLVLQVPVLFPQGPEICQHYAEQATALKRAGTPIERGLPGAWFRQDSGLRSGQHRPHRRDDG